ncbi:SdiA-regulated domain-containing protein [Paraflavisolibacter sp. H34]|uniref:SdiA-regulated domain-containing protein n=1 Tax=Huijunlia imazamoxiresistens TaxID=3127457 RepID=UPI00301B0029
MSKIDKMALLVVVVVVLPLVFWGRIQPWIGPEATVATAAGAENKVNREKEGFSEPGAGGSQLNVAARWELPPELMEVSGIAYLDRDRFVCIQDEKGALFVYNVQTGKIEQEIPFAGPGDYEGVTLAGTDAFVVRSDGRLYEIADFRGKNPRVKEHRTPLTAKQDVEGLCYDAREKRLLLAPKGEDPTSKEYKGIYAVDPGTGHMQTAPVLKIPVGEGAANGKKEKKKNKGVQPSEINVHPKTGQIYVLDGPNRRLLILERSGQLLRQVQLKGGDFPQAEGLTFSPEGVLYISNEGKGGKGTIVKVEE